MPKKSSKKMPYKRGKVMSEAEHKKMMAETKRLRKRKVPY